MNSNAKERITIPQVKAQVPIDRLSQQIFNTNNAKSNSQVNIITRLNVCVKQDAIMKGNPGE